MKRILNSKTLLAGSVSLVTLIVYLPSLQSDFVYWDDNRYVVDNPYIRSLDVSLLKFAFLDFYIYNWHPLTWISHALDYALWGLNPLGHHLTNNILHSVNTFVVVLLVGRLLEAARKLTGFVIPAGEARRESFRDALKDSGQAGMTESGDSSILHAKGRGTAPDNGMLIAAATTGLLFGLHPVHVESVAWVAERKDLLCALFFLLSIMMYMGYAGSGESGARSQESGAGGPEYDGSKIVIPRLDRGIQFLNKLYLLSLLFFMLALLSKPMAVTLPAVLLILDWYPLRRIRSLRTFWTAFGEKLPFIALSLVSSILTVMAQASGRAIWEAIPFPTRVLVAAKSLIAYLGNMILPLNLLPFYPHPRNVAFWSLEYLGAIALVVGITVICVVVAKRQKVWFSVWCYYVATLLPVLGLVQVGGQSMADRYTYLPSLGPFLVVGLWAAWVWTKISTFRKWGSIVKVGSAATVIVVFLLMSYLTFKQIGIWRNAMDLWNYVIEKEPERVLLAYYNRGHAYSKIGKYDKAIEDYSKVIALNYQEYSKVFIDRGLTYLKVGQVELAVSDLRKACDLGDDFGCKAVQYLIRK